MKSGLEVKKYFAVVSESQTKIMKISSLLMNIFTLMESLCSNYQWTHNVVPEIVGYRQYKYITEKEYKDVLTELTTDGVCDFSVNATTDILLESNDASNSIKTRAEKYAKIIVVPIVLPTLTDVSDELQLEFTELYKHYEYILNVVIADVLDSGISMTNFQMAQLNSINKEIRKKRKC